jgi:hypothetical protein
MDIFRAITISFLLATTGTLQASPITQKSGTESPGTSHSPIDTGTDPVTNDLPSVSTDASPGPDDISLPSSPGDSTESTDAPSAAISVVTNPARPAHHCIKQDAKHCRKKHCDGHAGHRHGAGSGGKGHGAGSGGKGHGAGHPRAAHGDEGAKMKENTERQRKEMEDRIRRIEERLAVMQTMLEQLLQR